MLRARLWMLLPGRWHAGLGGGLPCKGSLILDIHPVTPFGMALSVPGTPPNGPAEAVLRCALQYGAGRTDTPWTQSNVGKTISPHRIAFPAAKPQP